MSGISSDFDKTDSIIESMNVDLEHLVDRFFAVSFKQSNSDPETLCNSFKSLASQAADVKSQNDSELGESTETEAGVAISWIESGNSIVANEKKLLFEEDASIVGKTSESLIKKNSTIYESEVIHNEKLKFRKSDLLLDEYEKKCEEKMLETFEKLQETLEKIRFFAETQSKDEISGLSEISNSTDKNQEELQETFKEQSMTNATTESAPMTTKLDTFLGTPVAISDCSSESNNSSEVCSELLHENHKKSHVAVVQNSFSSIDCPILKESTVSLPVVEELTSHIEEPEVRVSDKLTCHIDKPEFLLQKKDKLLLQNKELLTELYSLPEVQRWRGRETLDPKMTRIPLDVLSTEYDLVLSAAGSPLILGIERNENIYLFAQYLLRKESRRRYSLMNHEFELYHSTPKLNIDNICTFNFDWRLAGRARGHKFGFGVSFAVHLSFAKMFPRKWISTDIIVARVLKRSSALGNLYTTLPPEGCDCTNNPKHEVFVKYTDDEFYPEYILHF